MIKECTATYLDGKTARRYPATVRLFPSNMQITMADGGARSWSYDKIRCTQGRYDGEHVRLEYGEPIPEVLLVQDQPFLDTLYRLSPRLGSPIHHHSRRTSRLILTAAAAAATIGIAVALLRWGIPALADVVTPRIPVAWDVELGQAVLDFFAEADNRCDDPILQARVEEILDATLGSRPTPFSFRVILLDDPQLNAFAAPGGPIIILRGLLRQTASPEELAGVLAHEVQHVILRHSTRALVQRASAGLLIAALTGDLSGAAAFGFEAARNLGDLRYGRTHEVEADMEGMRMIQESGIDPNGMITFYERLSQAGKDLPGILSFLSTHPATDERVGALRAFGKRPQSGTVNLGSHEEWMSVRERCRVENPPTTDGTETSAS